MSQIAHLNFPIILGTKDVRKNGTPPLKVQIYRSRNDRVFIGLKMYLRPEQWDDNRERVVNCVTAAVDNARLNNYRLLISILPVPFDKGSS